MSDEKPKVAGTISWCDLTVADAAGVRSFYEAVVGWKSEPLSMGDYEDYCMLPVDQQSPVAGICHAQGENAGLPPQWMVYITVTDLEKSLAEVEALGGTVIRRRKEFAIIRDPAGAHCALYQAAPN